MNGKNVAGRRHRRVSPRSFPEWTQSYQFRDGGIHVKTSPTSYTASGREKKSAKIHYGEKSHNPQKTVSLV